MSTTIISAAVAAEKYPRVPGIKTPGGSPIRDCGDKVAVALRGTGMDDWLEIAEQNGIRENLQVLIDAGKNTGQVRMALGRMLRARLDRHVADSNKNPEPYLPDPKPAPIKATPKPPEEDNEPESEDYGDDEVAEEDDSDDESA